MSQVPDSSPSSNETVSAHLDVRKVIVSTNIGETSITIPGVRHVIDCGRVKIKSFNPQTGLEVLQVQKISQAQAWQRTGRAGRECAGTCYRMFTGETVATGRSILSILVFLQRKNSNSCPPRRFPSYYDAICRRLLCRFSPWAYRTYPRSTFCPSRTRNRSQLPCEN